MELPGRFIRYCAANLEHSFAQNFQDLWALWASHGRRDGFFVEFGALNGVDFSNTYTLERIGWTGILSEPHPSYAERIRASRTCQFSPLCVYDETGKSLKFRMVKGRPALSGISETQLKNDKAELRNQFSEVDVETISLNDLLRRHNAPKQIDFISVDTEGSELRIMSAFDFDTFNVAAFCIEHNEEQRAGLQQIMTSKGYVRQFPELSGHDDWWVRADWTPPRLEDLPVLEDNMTERFDKMLGERRAVLARFLPPEP